MNTVASTASRLLALLALAALLPACDKDDDLPAAPVVPPAENANILLAGGTQLAALPTSNPAGINTPLALSGVAINDVLVSIDRRPQNNVLYGLGFDAAAGTVQLYAISHVTGFCTPIGTPAAFVASDGTTPSPVVGPRFGMDFNPTADRIRVVTESGQNFRLNPNTGAAVDGDLGVPATPGLNMDGQINAGTSTVQETAYTNNSSNMVTTTQYTLDATTDSLFIQNPPNSGTQTLGLTLLPAVDFVRGFDIPAGVDVAVSNTAAVGQGIAVVRFAGQAVDSVARVNLTTGALTDDGSLGAVTAAGLSVLDLNALPAVALDSAGTSLIRFAAATPGTTTTVAVTGVTAGETLVGIDFRPHNGQLYAIGVNPTTDTATAYVLDPQTGTATAVGAASQIAFTTDGVTVVDFPDPAVVSWGVDFNPTVDRIRVVTESGLNFRVHPGTGAPVDFSGGVTGVNPDGALSGAATGASSTAYTNSFVQLAGSGFTTQYALDPVGNTLCLLTNPNAGAMGSPLAVTLGGLPLDFSGASGFDISDDVRVAASSTPAVGSGYAALTVGGVCGLYRINLATGAATLLGSIGAGNPLRGLTVGQRSVK